MCCVVGVMECNGIDAASATWASGTPAPANGPELPDISFHDVLSALNPLQYVPVVGSIYRAVTGDIPPEPLRTMGSLLVSGLTGGPVGLAINAAVTGAEKLTGIDPDTIMHSVLADVGLVDQDVAASAAPGDTAAAAYAKTAALAPPGGL
jgi:hypothetical protein